MGSPSDNPPLNAAILRLVCYDRDAGELRLCLAIISIRRRGIAGQKHEIRVIFPLTVNVDTIALALKPQHRRSDRCR